jgi:hypothetical protein
MTTYTIYLGSAPIACVAGTEFAYAVYRKTVELAEMLGKTAALVWDETGEEVASYGEEEDEEYLNEDWDDYEPDVDETGFDPYEGCYTWDC